MDRKMVQNRVSIRTDFRKNAAFYMMILPGLLSILLFSYGPMFGLSLAWLDYNPILGLAKSKFVGWKHFEAAFKNRFMWEAIRNTVIIKVGQTLVTFPCSVMLAIAMSELSRRFRKFVQTMTILPYFVSWIIVASMFRTLLNVNGGLVNEICVQWLGMEPRDYLSDPQFFRLLVIFQDTWKMSGYFAMIYLAAITSIDTTLYEVARIDGASRLRRIWSVTLPGIRPTLITMAIMLSGYLIVGPFDQIFTQYSAAVYSTADIVETYTYRIGFQNQKYSFSTAVSLMQSIVATALVLTANGIIKRINRETSLV